MGWDDEELDTQIFDKDHGASPAEPASKADSQQLFFQEDGDRTVASEPPPDMLRAATAPEHLVTPPPVLEPPRGKTPPSPAAAGHTARAARPTGPSGRPRGAGQIDAGRHPDQQSADPALGPGRARRHRHHPAVVAAPDAAAALQRAVAVERIRPARRTADDAVGVVVGDRRAAR